MGHVESLNTRMQRPIALSCSPSDPPQAVVPRCVPSLPLKEWRRPPNPIRGSHITSKANPAFLRHRYLYWPPVESRTRRETPSAWGGGKGLADPLGQTLIYIVLQRRFGGIQSYKGGKQGRNRQDPSRASHTSVLEYSEYNMAVIQNDQIAEYLIGRSRWRVSR